jgi:hypothetical protein
MYRKRLGTMDLSTALAFLLGTAVCYAAWLKCSALLMARGHC